ncbi:RecF/RecN/SMC [Artemisia annua]|uniref:RecF/RecN/SMC n=1 Tax=Artemisia annua TaxID=35608 RepID=A0A2U1Q6K4_ARTAN|nr:RecF/RecN/SMC [Artemisia annua]
MAVAGNQRNDFYQIMGLKKESIDVEVNHAYKESSVGTGSGGGIQTGEEHTTSDNRASMRSNLLEALNEKRPGVVQMVKLADKERESLESVKNEEEDYMLTELSLLKWREKTVKFASEDNAVKMEETKKTASGLQENITAEREKIQDNLKVLKELETLHNKHMKRQEELATALKRCKDEFKEFERQDVKHREDLKHVKQKIKKMEEKAEKDATKITEITRQSQESTDLIPKLEEDIRKLQKDLLDEDTILESSKDKFVILDYWRYSFLKTRLGIKSVIWDQPRIKFHGHLGPHLLSPQLLHGLYPVPKIVGINMSSSFSIVYYKYK